MTYAVLMYPQGFLFELKKSKMIGFACSAALHILALVVTGMVFVKPVQFGLDAGLSGMEVQLVAGVEEVAPVVLEKEIVPETPPMVEEIIPQPIPEPVVQKVEPPPAEAKPLGNSSFNAAAATGNEDTMLPDYLNNPSPRYPSEARRRGFEGVVLLNVAVSRSGKATSVSVSKSSGHRMLDDSAVKTVRTWSFRPATIGQLPVETTVKVPIRFTLSGAKS